ncbi:MAG: hypothetical protein LBB88_02685, partial [Planctomycetaceae bacterium]|nr:hypothetical protein [Planctomycetaceae bacterium]
MSSNMPHECIGCGQCWANNPGGGHLYSDAYNNENTTIIFNYNNNVSTNGFSQGYQNVYPNIRYNKFTDNGIQDSYSCDNTTTINVTNIDLEILENSHANNLDFDDFSTAEPNISNAINEKPKPKGEEPVVEQVQIGEIPVSDQGTGSPFVAGVKAFFGTLGSELFGVANQLTFGLLDSEQYALQVEAQGERLYNISRNLGYSDESIASGVGLGQALVGELVGTNALAEAGVGYDLGNNTMLDGMERIEKAIVGTSQVAGTLAAGLSVTKSLLRNCFLAGTLVSRYSPDNYEQKELIPIEQIKFCDQVWSFNFSKSQWEVKPVLEIFRTQYDGDIVTINIDDDIIHATGGHPFWVIEGVDLEDRPVCDCLPDCDQKTTPNGRWVYARDLQIGDVVQSRSFGEQKISA